MVNCPVPPARPSANNQLRSRLARPLYQPDRPPLCIAFEREVEARSGVDEDLDGLVVAGRDGAGAEGSGVRAGDSAVAAFARALRLDGAGLCLADGFLRERWLLLADVMGLAVHVLHVHLCLRGLVEGYIAEWLVIDAPPTLRGGVTARAR